MREEAEPGACVGGDFQIRDSDASLLYVQRFILNGDGSFALFGTRENEVVRGDKALRLFSLKRHAQTE